MMNRRAFLAPALACAALTALPALSLAQEGGDPGKIKIVSSLPRTGSANAQTTSMVNGIRMAIEDAGGKVAGMTIVYEDWDDASPQRGAWDPALEAANADKAIKDPDVMVYIGTYNSGAAKISMPKLNQAGICMISPGNTYTGLTKPGKGEANEPMAYRPSGRINYYRVVPADDIQGTVAADWAKEMGFKTVYVLHDRELYGQGVASVFEARAKKVGLTVAGFEGIDPKAPNYKSLVTKIRQKRADLVYFGGTTQTNAGQLAKDIASGGLKAKMMGPDGCFETAFIEAAGKENVEGRVFLTFGGVPGKELKGKGEEFYKRYKAKFNQEPEAYAAYGYECAAVAIAGIARAGKKDRWAITEAVGQTKDFDGVLGKWSFDENGDTSITTMSGNTVKGGKLEFVKVLGQ